MSVLFLFCLVYCACLAASTNILTLLLLLCLHVWRIKGSTSDPALPPPHQHTFNKPHQEERYSSTATRRQCSTSHKGSELIGPISPSRAAAQRNTTSWSNQGCVDISGQMRGDMREPVNEDSDDSDTVFNQQLALWCRRLYDRPNRTPHQQPAPSQQQHERNRRCFSSRRSLPDEINSWQLEETEDLDEDCYENDDLRNRTARRQTQERNHRDGSLLQSRGQETDCRSSEVRERQRRRSESVRIPDSGRQRDLPRTLSYRDSSDKHVRFQDDDRQHRQQQNENNKVWLMLGQILKERGVPVRFGGSGAPLQIRPQSRDSQVLHGSEVSCRDSQPHQRAFQRAATTRHSFHGDIRERRRLSHREDSGRDHRGVHNGPRDNKELYEINRDPNAVNRERQGSTRWKEHKHTNGDENGERNPNRRVRRTTSERGHHRVTEERLSSEEEQEADRRVERPRRRALQRSHSCSSRRASTRQRSSREAAGNTRTCCPLSPAEGRASNDVFLSSLFTPELLAFPPFSCWNQLELWLLCLGSFFLRLTDCSSLNTSSLSFFHLLFKVIYINVFSMHFFYDLVFCVILNVTRLWCFPDSAYLHDSSGCFSWLWHCRDSCLHFLFFLLLFFLGNVTV